MMLIVVGFLAQRLWFNPRAVNLKIVVDSVII